MIEKARYVNHMNEVIEFGANGIYINENDLHDFAWTATSMNDKISSFKMGIVKKSLPVVFACRNDDEGTESRNRLFEVCEKDVVARKHGKLYIGDYYMRCYVTGCKASKYTYNKRYMKNTLTIQTDYPQWIKETIITFNSNEEIVGKNLDYNNDHPYDYTSNILGKKLQNVDFVNTNFRMRIYGPCKSPEILLGGHMYSVDVDIEANEYLTIDSVEKTIILYESDGSQRNCFDLRNRDSYIFQKIPPGVMDVATSSKLIFDITLLEERSIPRWT